MSKLEAEYHINGVVTTRRFLRTQEDVVRRFLKAYVEGAARGQKDKNFALKVMGKYFRTDDKEILEESYETTIKSQFLHPALSVDSGNRQLDSRSGKTESQSQKRKAGRFRR